MNELQFDVFGHRIAVAGEQGAWRAFMLGPDGKRRPAEFVVPGFLAADELCQYLADLLHEFASPANSAAVRIK